MLLTPENCPGISLQRLTAVNAMSDAELRLEIEKGRSSRFGEPMHPVLRLALKLREDHYKATERQEEISISRDANRIAEAALLEARAANKAATSARLWSGIAVLVTALLALSSVLSGS